MFLFFLLIIAIVLSVCLTLVIRFYATRTDIQDRPKPPLKNHSKPTPLLGGVAIFFAFIAIILLITYFKKSLFGFCTIFDDPYLAICSEDQGLILISGIILAILWLCLGGVLDDKYKLSPRYQIIWPILAVLSVILAGLGQDNITNPLYLIGLADDPLWHLNVWTINVFGLEFTLFTDLFTFCWLLLLIYVTKFLDGLNGLVSGITVIGAAILFITSLILGQPLSVLLAVIIAGIYLGFLPFNFSGKIFLGEAGSTMAGFFLGVLAILGPAKISIILLVLGIPILDAIWVVYDRLAHKKSPFRGDLRHLHFKLVKSGLSSKRAVFLLWLISLAFGWLGLALTGSIQLFLILILIGLMVLLVRLTK